MPRYQIVLHAHNILIEEDGRLRKRGFYTARRLQAPDPDTAAHLAVTAVLEDDDLTEAVRNDPTDPPTIEVDKLFEVYEIANLEAGFIWYEERSWWQFWK